MQRKLMKEVNSGMCDGDYEMSDDSSTSNQPGECAAAINMCSDMEPVSTASCAEPVVFDSDIPPLSSQDVLESSVDDLKSELAQRVMNAHVSREDCNTLLECCVNMATICQTIVTL